MQVHLLAHSLPAAKSAPTTANGHFIDSACRQRPRPCDDNCVQFKPGSLGTSFQNGPKSNCLLSPAVLVDGILTFGSCASADNDATHSHLANNAEFTCHNHPA